MNGKKLRIQLFGGFECRLDDGPLLLTSARKAQAMLAYLAMAQGKPCQRQHLADLLWGSHGEHQARNSLRQTLFVIRRELKGLPVLVAESGTIRFNASICQVDALDLEILARHKDAVSFDLHPESAASTLLDGFSLSEPAFEEWLETERRRCRELACQRRSKNQPRGGAKVYQLRVPLAEGRNGFRGPAVALSR